MRRLVSLAIGGLVATWLWAEVVNRRASGRRLGTAPYAAGTRAVVVLGFGDRGERANAINRFRVRAGLRTLRPGSVLVLCGGCVEGHVPEAELLARYARERGYRGGIRLDTTSTTTRENIENAIPLIEDASTIAIVSHPPHAEVGREILWELRPDLAARLVRGEDYRFGETPLVKIVAAARIVLYRMRPAGVSPR